MSGHSSGSNEHHLRFYIIAITVIVGVIFLFFLFNDKEDLTGAVSGLANGSDLFSDEEITVESSKTIEQGEEITSEKDISLIVDKVPLIKNRATVNKVELTFTNPSSTITINQDRLELQDVQSVTLTLKDFVGDVALNGQALSLNGKSSRIAVNNIALVSDDDLDIYFTNLDYDSLLLTGLRLDHLEVPAGDGQLQAAERLTYQLQDDRVSLDYFKGNVGIGQGNGTFSLEGTVKSLSVSGDLLNLDLQ